VKIIVLKKKRIITKKIIMKKTILSLSMAFAICLSANTVSAQIVSEGDFIIDAYASGFVAKTLGEASGVPQLEEEFKHIGLPIGLGGKFEYMATENLGIGLEGNYVETGYQYGKVGERYSYTRTRLRVNFILNYHVIQNDEFDMYLGWGLGYKNTVRTWATDSEDQEELAILNAALGTLQVPISIKWFSCGGRYFFTDNIGMNFEVALGGGQLGKIGLTGKF
jgi:outer membrane protein W